MENYDKEFESELIDKTINDIRKDTKEEMLNIYGEKYQITEFKVDLDISKIVLPFQMPSLNKILMKNDKN